MMANAAVSCREVGLMHRRALAGLPRIHVLSPCGDGEKNCSLAGSR